MNIKKLPPEIVRSIAQKISPKDQTHFAITCKLYWHCFKDDIAYHRSCYEAFSLLGWYNAWHAIQSYTLEYLDDIWEAEEWRPATAIPSLKEFLQLGDVPEAWLAAPFDLASDLADKKYSPILGYLLTKAPNLRKLQFVHYDDLKYLTNIIPSIRTQLQSVDIRGSILEKSVFINIDLVHVLLSIPTLQNLAIENVDGGDDALQSPSVASSVNILQSQVEELRIQAEDFSRLALQQLFSRLPKLRTLSFEVNAEDIDGRFMLQQLAEHCHAIKAIHIEQVNPLCRDEYADHGPIKWGQFRGLQTISALWEDVMPLQDLPSTLKRVALERLDTAECGEALRVVRAVPRRFPLLESFNLNGTVRFRKGDIELTDHISASGG